LHNNLILFSNGLITVERLITKFEKENLFNLLLDIYIKSNVNLDTSKLDFEIIYPKLQFLNNYEELNKVIMDFITLSTIVIISCISGTPVDDSPVIDVPTSNNVDSSLTYVPGHSPELLDQAFEEINNLDVLIKNLNESLTSYFPCQNSFSFFGLDYFLLKFLLIFLK
jgi:hypothetical protein